MKIHPLVLLAGLLSILIFLTWPALAAEDCGCGGLPDASPPAGYDDPGFDISTGWSSTAADAYAGGTASSGGTNTDGSGGSGNSGGNSGGTDTGGSGSSSDGSGGTGGQYYSGSGSEASWTGSPNTGSGQPGDAAVWLSKAREYSNAGLYNESLGAYNISLSKDPYIAAAWSGKGDVLFRMGRYAGAIDAYDRALRLDPSGAEWWESKADAYGALGDYAGAVAAYTRALAVNPLLPDAPGKRQAALVLVAGTPVNTTPTAPPTTEPTTLPVPPDQIEAAVTTTDLPTQSSPAPMVAVLAGTAMAFVWCGCKRKH